MLNKIKLTTFILIILIFAWIGYYFDFDIKEIFSSLREVGRSSPFLASFIFVVFFVFFKFTFVPMSSVSLLSGYIFGIWLGTLLSLLAITISSFLSFVLARHLGRESISNFLEKRFDWIDKYNKLLEEKGFLTVLFFRIVPVLPLAVINFGFGISRVSLKNFLLATVVGSFPGVLFLSGAGKYIDDWKNPIFFLFVGAFFLIIILAYLVALKYRREHEKF